MEIPFNIKNLSEKKAKKILLFLKNKINKYNNAYYRYNQSIISDSEFDELFRINLKIEEKFPHLVLQNSPSKKVGGELNPMFLKEKHLSPMLSLSNAFSNEDLLAFIKRIKKKLNIDTFEPICCEPKIDGLSFSAIFINGNLNVATTRGNGYIGENITNNIKTIKNFPLSLKRAPKLLEVRGEIFILKNDFIKLNKQRVLLGKQEFSNPRNAASGSLRQIDWRITAERPLRYFVYGIGTSDISIANSQFEILQKLQEYNFLINNLNKLAFSVEDLLLFHKDLNMMREKLDYEIDGAVYKVNNFNSQKKIGSIARSPNFAIAHKFAAIITTTKLEDIVIQVGRTGVITPVAKLKPINIGGVKITRASLHNYHEIIKKDIRIGDFVFLKRAGDVIPYIIGPDLTKRPKNTKLIVIPNLCPRCNSNLDYTNNKIIRCINGLNCKDQYYERICHFISKDALNIDGLGKVQLFDLINKGFIKTPIDIFHLEEGNNSKMRELVKMPRWGATSVRKLFFNIRKAKTVKLENFIYSLGIEKIGLQYSKLLAKEFKTSSNFIKNIKLIPKNTEEFYIKFKKLNGIGEKILSKIIDFFKIEENLNLIEDLNKILNIQDYDSNIIVNLMNDKVITFTGKLTGISRDQAKLVAEKLGAKVFDSIRSSTNLLIVGQNPGDKIEKAKKRNIPLMQESEWIELISKYITN